MSCARLCITSTVSEDTSERLESSRRRFLDGLSGAPDEGGVSAIATYLAMSGPQGVQLLESPSASLSTHKTSELCG